MSEPTTDSPARTGRGSLYTTLELIRIYLGVYGTFTFVLSAVTTGVGLLMLFEAYGSSDGLGFLAFLLATGTYGLACAMAMFRCWIALRRGEPEAPRWTRWSMLASIPGSVITGTIGFGFLALGTEGLTHASPSPFLWIPFLLGGTVFLGALANVVILLRVLFWHDLEDLLWDDLQANIDLGMNLREDHGFGGQPREESTVFARSEDAVSDVAEQQPAEVDA